jgi:acetate kinase
VDVDVTTLAINCGSSSLKFAVFSGDVETRRGQAATIEEVLHQLADRPDAVGHRIVHGGPDHFAPAIIDDALLASLRRAIPFAPLHLPIELAAIAAVAKHFPNIRQVVCFDTAFHRTLPPVAYRFALPAVLFDAGVRRYGFHGLSYEYISSVVTTTKRAVFAHLGSGASMVAVRDGVAIDTTMGMTPSGGLVMGTRCGDLDPGVMVYLLAHGYDARSLGKLVDREAGLFALAGSADMQHLLEARATDPRAALAVDIFCYQAVKSLGALVAVLGGIDQLVFTGGIGEHAPAVRDKICEGLGYLGTFDVRVIATDEEAMIARHTRAFS